MSRGDVYSPRPSFGQPLITYAVVFRLQDDAQSPRSPVSGTRTRSVGKRRGTNRGDNQTEHGRPPSTVRCEEEDLV